MRYISTALALVFLFPAGLQANDPGGRSLRFAEKYSQFAVGGGGRYLVFHFEKQKKASVYDITTGKRTFDIEEVASGDWLAASARKLVVVSSSKMMIRRWDFESQKREKVALIDGNDPPVGALMGCSGDGPLLVIGSKQSQFFDLETLKPIKVLGPTIPGKGRDGLSVQISANGRTFGTIPKGYGPVGFAITHIQGNRTTQVPFGGTSDAIRWAQPSGDGYLIMRPGGGIVNRNGRNVKADWLAGGAIVPSPDHRFILDVRVDYKNESTKQSGKITVCSSADCRPIVSQVGFEELVPKRISSWHDIVNALRLGHRWRVQYVPSANMLVTLPQDNIRMILRPFDLEHKLKVQNKDHLFVESIPPLAVRVGATLDYRPKVRTNAKKFSISLEDGPEGAKWNKDKVQWLVPENYPEQWARFLLSVKNSDEKEIFHTFEVAVRNAPIEE